MGQSNEMQEEWRDQYIGGGRLTHLLLPRWQTRSQQVTAALTARPRARKRRRRAKNRSIRAKLLAAVFFLESGPCCVGLKPSMRRKGPGMCAGRRRMRADGPDTRDCRAPSAGVMVEDLIPAKDPLSTGVQRCGHFEIRTGESYFRSQKDPECTYHAFVSGQM